MGAVRKYVPGVVEVQKKEILILFFVFSRAAPMVYGGSQARGQIGAIATGLRHIYSHSNVGFELCLQPIPQFTAMPDP